MAKWKIKTGNVDIPDDEFKEESMTAHLSIRLTERYKGRYQTLMKDILLDWVAQKNPKENATNFGPDTTPESRRYRRA